MRPSNALAAGEVAAVLAVREAGPQCAVVVADEVAHARHDLLAPLAAVEDAVVTNAWLLPVHMACAGDVGRERVGGLGLADAGDVVELALDRHQRGLDGGRIDLAAAAHPDAARQLVLLEHDLDGLQVELGGEVHHREILVVEGAMAVGRIVVAFHEMLELAHVGVDVPVEVHADERGELQEARIDPAHRARIGEGHRRDDVLAEPHHRVAHRQIIGRGRADARVDRAAHQGDRSRLARILVGGHQRGRRHHRHRRLADRDDMDVRPEIAAELHDVVDVVVEIEVALGERHLAGVGPVGDVHVVVGQQRLDRAAQQGGVVAAHRRHHQHLGIAPCRCRDGSAAAGRTACAAGSLR